MSEIKQCSECQFWANPEMPEKDYPTCFVDSEMRYRPGDSPPCAFIYEWIEEREGGVEATVLPGGDPVFLTDGDA